MSDYYYIPLEIQAEIIKKLPVKFVIQCRSVSKLLKSLIDGPEFIKSYHTCNTQPQHHLLIRYDYMDNYWSLAEKDVSVVDDDTFPNHKSSITVPHPVSLLCGPIPTTFSSVNGLLCFHSLLPNVRGKTIAILWNPSIQKSVTIAIPNSLLSQTGRTRIGFGVCPNTSDPKLVKINNTGYSTLHDDMEVEDVFIVNNWEVEVFMLSTRVWKSVSNIPPAFKTCRVKCRHVCIDGFIYWLAYDSIKWADGIISNLIISFHLKSDELGEVCLPDRLVHTDRLLVSEVYELLGLFEYYNEVNTRGCDVWILKEGVMKSFTKILSIRAPDRWVDYNVLEIRKNGKAIIENIDETTRLSELEVYDTSSGSISGMGINGAPRFFLVNSYMETLLLLDESNSIIY